jgi:hypothetical protein
MPLPPPPSIEPCPLCERPNLSPSDHHLVPKSRGGKETLAICRDCHRAVHALFTNKELEKQYHTVESLLEHVELRKMLAFIARQDPGGKVRMRRPKGRGKKP